MSEQAPPQREHVDLSTEEYTEKFAAAPLFAKKAIVKIRPATPGEKLETKLADGTVETVNTAGENQVVVTNPGGEEYIIDAEKAQGRYEETEEPGVFRAKGMARILDNPTGGDVSVTAPWGEEQIGAADCKFASLYDPTQPEVISADRYIIGAAEFAETYGTAEEVLGLQAPTLPANTQPESPQV